MVHNNIHVHSWTNTGLITFNGAGVDPVITLPLLVLCGKCLCDVDKVSQIVCKLFEEVVFGFIPHCPVSDKRTKPSVYGWFEKRVHHLQYSVAKPVPKCTFYNQIQ